jgi:hypothetical protein
MSEYGKFPIIVTNKIIKEKIKFQGKIITRERVEKQWNIPKIINSDISFQLMFGISAPPTKNYSTESGIDTIKINLPTY